ncbi:MAG: PilN domain-containing protein [Candidatus Buchananbacteria bacterium]
MMITLNIISPQQKEDLKLKKLYHEARNLITIILLFTIIAAIMVLVARYILQKEFYELVKQNTLVSQSNQKINRQIRTLNQQVTTVDKIQTQYKDYHAFLGNFFQLVPSGIQLYYFKINSEQITELKGRATTRDALLTFKQALEKNPGLSNINLPVSNLLDQTNLNFSLTCKITTWLK